MVWSPEDIPDLAGKVVIVTGGTSGIGMAAARELARKHAHVIITGRNPKKGNKAADTLKEQAHGAEVEFMPCDMSTFETVKEFVDKFKARKLPLHMLLNNAGMTTPPKPKAPNGMDMTYMSNYYGAWHLTQLLLDCLKSSAPSRVVFQSSVTEFYGTIDWSDLRGERLKGSNVREYCTTKLWNLMSAREFGERLKGTGVDVFAVHPGWTASDISTNVTLSQGLYYWAGAKLFQVATAFYGQSIDRGAHSMLYAATAPELQGHSGGFFGPWYKGLGLLLFVGNLGNTDARTPQNPWARNDAACARLFEETARILEAETGVKNQLPTKGQSTEAPNNYLELQKEQVGQVTQAGAAAAKDVANRLHHAGAAAAQHATDAAHATADKAGGAAHAVADKADDATNGRAGNAAGQVVDASRSAGARLEDGVDKAGGEGREAARGVADMVGRMAAGSKLRERQPAGDTWLLTGEE